MSEETNLYVVMANNGQQWEDSYNWPVAVADSEDEGKALIESLDKWRADVTAGLPYVSEYDYRFTDEQEAAWERAAEIRDAAAKAAGTKFGLCPDAKDIVDGFWHLYLVRVPKVKLETKEKINVF